MAETQVVVMNFLLQLRVDRRAGVAAVVRQARLGVADAQRQDGESTVHQMVR